MQLSLSRSFLWAVTLPILTSVLSAPPAHPDVLAHKTSNLSQEGGGSPASPPTSLSHTGLSLPHCPSRLLSLSLSVFTAHACSDADVSE